MPGSIDSFTSQKFRFWFFVSIILLLFVHSYNLNLRYLQPSTIVHERLTCNSFIQYFLSNGLFRFFIPMLFSISGYLYATHDERPYGKSIGIRLRTILLPYLIWSAVGLLFTYLIELSVYGRSIVEATHLMQLNNNRILIHEYKWYELLYRWVFLPVPYQLWFLRVLFIYNLLYPALLWSILRYTKLFFLIVILFWASNIQFLLFEGEGLFFFSLGIWLQKRNFDIREPNKWLQPWPWGSVFIILAAIKTIVAFKVYDIIGYSVIPLLLILHKVVVFSGFVAAWFGCNRPVRWFMKKQWFVWLSTFSFIIYVLHAPLIAYAINVIFPLVQHTPEYRLLTFLLLPVGLLVFCIGTGILIKTVSPKLYALLTGGRGLGKPKPFLLTLILICFLFKSDLKAQATAPKRNYTNAGFGYNVKGDSIEIILGQQQIINWSSI